MSDKEGGRTEGRRARKVQESRAAMANAAVDLVLDRGLDQVTVEAISERADVSRRTFSRYFSGKEDAVVDTLRADYARINTALAARPPQETPLTAYYRALRGWLDDEPTAWHRRLPRSRDLLRLLHEEPALLPAYLRVQDEAENESVAIVARRLGLDANAICGPRWPSRSPWGRSARPYGSGPRPASPPPSRSSSTRRSRSWPTSPRPAHPAPPPSETRHHHDHQHQHQHQHQHSRRHRP